jgi:hypothetical protein
MYLTEMGSYGMTYVPNVFFFNFPIYLQSVTIHSDTFSKWCVWKRGRVEECSVASLCNKRAKTVCGCREKRIQTHDDRFLHLSNIKVITATICEAVMLVLLIYGFMK